MPLEFTNEQIVQYIKEQLADNLSMESCLAMLKDLAQYKIVIYKNNLSYFRGQELAKLRGVEKEGEKFSLTGTVISGIRESLWNFCLSSKNLSGSEDFPEALRLARFVYVKLIPAEDFVKDSKALIDSAKSKRSELIRVNHFVIEMLKIYQHIENMRDGKMIDVREQIYGFEVRILETRERFERGSNSSDNKDKERLHQLRKYLGVTEIISRLDEIWKDSSKTPNLQWILDISNKLLATNKITVEIDGLKIEVSASDLYSEMDFNDSDKFTFKHDKKTDVRDFYAILHFMNGSQEESIKYFTAAITYYLREDNLNLSLDLNGAKTVYATLNVLIKDKKNLWLIELQRMIKEKEDHLILRNNGGVGLFDCHLNQNNFFVAAQFLLSLRKELPDSKYVEKSDDFIRKILDKKTLTEQLNILLYGYQIHEEGRLIGTLIPSYQFSIDWKTKNEPSTLGEKILYGRLIKKLEGDEVGFHYLKDLFIQLIKENKFQDAVEVLSEIKKSKLYSVKESRVIDELFSEAYLNSIGLNFNSEEKIKAWIDSKDVNQKEVALWIDQVGEVLKFKQLTYMGLVFRASEPSSKNKADFILPILKKKNVVYAVQHELRNVTDSNKIFDVYITAIKNLLNEKNYKTALKLLNAARKQLFKNPARVRTDEDLNKIHQRFLNFTQNLLASYVNHMIQNSNSDNIKTLNHIIRTGRVSSDEGEKLILTELLDPRIVLEPLIHFFLGQSDENNFFTLVENNLIKLNIHICEIVLKYFLVKSFSINDYKNVALLLSKAKEKKVLDERVYWRFSKSVQNFLLSYIYFLMERQEGNIHELLNILETGCVKFESTEWNIVTDSLDPKIVFEPLVQFFLTKMNENNFFTLVKNNCVKLNIYVCEIAIDYLLTKGKLDEDDYLKIVDLLTTVAPEKSDVMQLGMLQREKYFAITQRVLKSYIDSLLNSENSEALLSILKTGMVRVGNRDWILAADSPDPKILLVPVIRFFLNESDDNKNKFLAVLQENPSELNVYILKIIINDFLYKNNRVKSNYTDIQSLLMMGIPKKWLLKEFPKNLSHPYTEIIRDFLTSYIFYLLKNSKESNDNDQELINIVQAGIINIGGRNWALNNHLLNFQLISKSIALFLLSKPLLDIDSLAALCKGTCRLAKLEFKIQKEILNQIYYELIDKSDKDLNLIQSCYLLLWYKSTNPGAQFPDKHVLRIIDKLKNDTNNQVQSWLYENRRYFSDHNDIKAWITSHADEFLKEPPLSKIKIFLSKNDINGAFSALEKFPIECSGYLDVVDLVFESYLKTLKTPQVIMNALMLGYVINGKTYKASSDLKKKWLATYFGRPDILMQYIKTEDGYDLLKGLIKNANDINDPNDLNCIFDFFKIQFEKSLAQEPVDTEYLNWLSRIICEKFQSGLDEERVSQRLVLLDKMVRPQIDLYVKNNDFASIINFYASSLFSIPLRENIPLPDISRIYILAKILIASSEENLRAKAFYFNTVISRYYFNKIFDALLMDSTLNSYSVFLNLMTGKNDHLGYMHADNIPNISDSIKIKFTIENLKALLKSQKLNMYGMIFLADKYQNENRAEEAQSLYRLLYEKTRYNKDKTFHDLIAAKLPQDSERPETVPSSELTEEIHNLKQNNKVSKLNKIYWIPEGLDPEEVFQLGMFLVDSYMRNLFPKKLKITGFFSDFSPFEEAIKICNDLISRKNNDVSSEVSGYYFAAYWKLFELYVAKSKLEEYKNVKPALLNSALENGIMFFYKTYIVSDLMVFSKEDHDRLLKLIPLIISVPSWPARLIAMFPPFLFFQQISEYYEKLNQKNIIPDANWYLSEIFIARARITPDLDSKKTLVDQALKLQKDYLDAQSKPSEESRQQSQFFKQQAEKQLSMRREKYEENLMHAREELSINGPA